MDGTNLGWWVVALPVAVPLLLLLVMHLLARLESWMFAPDERAAKVETLLQEVAAPDQVEAEVTRLLADVAEVNGRSPASDNGRVDERRPRRPGQRVDRAPAQDRRARLRQAVARASALPRRQERPR